MNTRQLPVMLLGLLGHLLMQVLVFRRMMLFDVALAFVYVRFLLILPTDINRIIGLLLAFGMGLSVDIFYDTAGMHAAACVLLAFARHFLLEYNKPSAGYEPNDLPDLYTLGAGSFMTYSLALIAMHHGLLFLLEASSWQLIGQTVQTFVGSVLFTWLLVFGYEYARSFRGRR